MKYIKEKNAEQKNAAEQAAQNEEKILPEHLLQEIEPLLKEYFIGKFNLYKNKIVLAFKNGQYFKITVKEI